MIGDTNNASHNPPGTKSFILGSSFFGLADLKTNATLPASHLPYHKKQNKVKPTRDNVSRMDEWTHARMEGRTDAPGGWMETCMGGWKEEGKYK